MLGKLSKLDTIIHTTEEENISIKASIVRLEAEKAEKVNLKALSDLLDESIRKFDIRIDKQRDNLLTLEHYCERYIPCQA